MKLILLVVCGLAFFKSFVFSVSEKNLQQYITKSLKGFKNVMLKGDEDLNYPIMEPYKIGNYTWDFIDTSGSNKHSLKTSFDQCTLQGLSNYNINRVTVSGKDIRFNFGLTFSNLETKIPYKLDGYIFKGIMPVYGEGLLKLSTPAQQFYVSIDLGIEKGFIVLESLHLHRYNNDINVKVTGLMDLPNKFAGYALDDILDNIVKEYRDKALQNYMSDLIEEIIGGMTMDEIFKFLDHFVKKCDEK
ncbi:uncharacterized protein LOC135843842 [Planococcus citri]|uniref:uncharacterized protein LOC135843842 n=1 Tax=Planococcus citri TaxID=170843 RepID=UPI0031F8CC8C